MIKSKLLILAGIILTACIFSDTNAQVKFYRTNGGEIIFSNAMVQFENTQVNTNMRFTMFFHGQQQFNLDFGEYLGIFSGIGLRNVGFITEDLYQNVGFIGIDNSNPNWNKSTKIKRRSYSLGIPLALKIGKMGYMNLYGGAEYEWMFHYKQKMFIDKQKVKFSEWNSDRVNQFIPSVFAGIRLPKGINIKVRYYLDNFLNPSFTGIDFDENVDYSHFQTTGIWYISLAVLINNTKVKEMVGIEDGKKL